MLRKTVIKMAAIAASLVILTNVNVKGAESNETMKSAKDVVSDMGVGWNLGNTLDSHGDWITQKTQGTTRDFETAWGNPVTTKAMIDKVKEGGFKTIRIPVTWRQHMGQGPNYTVDKAWMDRVNEVVDYAIDNELYVILNVHHDEEWCKPTFANQARAKIQLQALWTQIANRFQRYDSHLIFETLNEPRVVGSKEEWVGGTYEGRQVVNNLNEVALKTIRSTGGNNAKRAVMIPTYAATGQQVAINDYKVQNDPNIIVSLHAYTPYQFAMEVEGTKNWGSSSDRSALTNELTGYYNFFKAKGLPVVIGEFGTINKGNTSSRVEHAKAYIETATKLGMPCVWWDNGIHELNNDNSYAIIDRNSLKWTFPEIRDALINTYKKYAKPQSSQDKPNQNKPSQDKPNQDKPSQSNKELSVNVKKNQWQGGFQLMIDIKNNTNTAINGWTLKIKRNNMKISSAWNVDYKIEGNYIVVTPKLWLSSVAPNGIVSFGMQGDGVADNNIQYEIVKR